MPVSTRCWTHYLGTECLASNFFSFAHGQGDLIRSIVWLCIFTCAGCSTTFEFVLSLSAIGREFVFIRFENWMLAAAKSQVGSLTKWRNTKKIDLVWCSLTNRWDNRLNHIKTLLESRNFIVFQFQTFGRYFLRRHTNSSIDFHWLSCLSFHIKVNHVIIQLRGIIPQFVSGIRNAP